MGSPSSERDNTLRSTADIGIDIDVTTTSTMKISQTVELLLLTFNCAKNLIDVPVFGAHLRGALEKDGGGALPEVVVMSLQEIAPLSYSFLGEWFLGPYYAAFGDALNLAVEQTGEKYTLVKAKNVGMTALLVFSLRPEWLDLGGMREGEVGFGAADMGNKGAVGVRVAYAADGTEFTFVATHLAAMEWNLKKRNKNWGGIVSGLTFEDPRGVVLPPGEGGPKVRGDRWSGAGERSAPGLERGTGGFVDSSEEDEEGAPLILSTSDAEEEEEEEGMPNLTKEQRAKLQEMSIFKPDSHLFVAGDLNYRISSTTPPPGSRFPSFDPSSEHHYSTFFERDQLTQERLAGRTFHGMSEAEVGFGPTYKYNVLTDPTGAENEESVRQGSTVNGVKEVPWKFASHRWPAWTDRVLYSAAEGHEAGVETVRYDSLPVVESSDHRAVFLRVRVPLTGAARAQERTVKERGETPELAEAAARRKELPVNIDVWSWERRQKARRKELIVGMLALVWSTKEGAVFLGTVVTVGMGWWWFARGGFV
ncbi:Endonuclease/exonuclease/phosphatase [Triangularia verruculosa]|uniref:Endonuclease/exonuclease/phosphatase n=1 Tax=Triangularia verruculosa TaxID=2587418 RepID=A0AAN6XAB2_9PEZI|nr:Endonuclease/exonuclease/phosphatase [Triangularia verruculosa]